MSTSSAGMFPTKITGSGCAVTMVSSLTRLALLVLGVGLSYATPSPRATPTVTLDKGVFSGASDGNTNKFLGIPFAKPP